MSGTTPSMPDHEDEGRSRSVLWVVASLALVAVLAVVAVVVLTGDDEADDPADAVDGTVASSLPVEDESDDEESVTSTTSEADDPVTTAGSVPSTTAAGTTPPTTTDEANGTPPDGATTTLATGGSPVPTTDDGGDTEEWTVSEIVNGDTLEVVGPSGSLTVGLLGVIAPSDEQCYADEAVEAITALVDGPLLLIEDGPDEDDTGRKLRYVETTDGADVGAEMILQGAAFADSTTTDITRWQGYAQRQVQAENEEVGMWEPGLCAVGEGGG